MPSINLQKEGGRKDRMIKTKEKKETKISIIKQRGRGRRVQSMSSYTINDRFTMKKIIITSNPFSFPPTNASSNQTKKTSKSRQLN